MSVLPARAAQDQTISEAAWRGLEVPGPCLEDRPQGRSLEGGFSDSPPQFLRLGGRGVTFLPPRVWGLPGKIIKLRGRRGYLQAQGTTHGRFSPLRSRAGTMSAEPANGPTEDQVEILEYNFNKVNRHPDPTTLCLIAAEAGLSEEETQVSPRGLRPARPGHVPEVGTLAGSTSAPARAPRPAREPGPASISRSIPASPSSGAGLPCTRHGNATEAARRPQAHPPSSWLFASPLPPG